MMDILYYVLGSLFVIIGFACLVLVVVQMPGTWIMLIIATLAHLADIAWIIPGMGKTPGCKMIRFQNQTKLSTFRLLTSNLKKTSHRKN